MAILSGGMECSVERRIDTMTTRFTADIHDTYVMQMAQASILQGIIERAVDMLTAEFVRQHGEAILAGVKPELVTTKVVEGVVKAMLGKMKE